MISNWKTPKRRHWCRSGAFIVSFHHISHVVLVSIVAFVSAEKPFIIWMCKTWLKLIRQRERWKWKLLQRLKMKMKLLQRLWREYIMQHTSWKVSKYRVFSGLYFPVFGLNTEIYSVNFCVQFKYRKIQENIFLTSTFI